MKRPSGWKANPQAMAHVSKVRNFSGVPELASNEADPDTWLTPRFILEHLGRFDLDPCAAVSNPQWCAPFFRTKIEDGLNYEWCGRVFMNPPFSNTTPWIIKHALHGNGISLVPASVESRVWREIVWKRAQAILLMHGRTRFCNPDGSATTGRPLRSIALIAWSPEDHRILKVAPFAGVLLTNWKQR